MSKIIVFGGAGFLGSHVADSLTIEGHEVTIFDRVLSKYLRDGQKMIVGDIMNRVLVLKATQGMDYVYHFAAVADIGEARNNPIDAANFNIIGTLNVLDACRINNVRRFIFSSTIYVYSDHGSFYRSSKQACELFIENYHKEYGLDFTVLRYGSLYGSRANNFNFIRNSIYQALVEKKIQRKGDGNEVRDYINVLDAAKISVDVLSEKYKGGYVMITGPQTMKVKELLLMIREMLQNDVELEFTEEKLAGHYHITPYSFKPKVALKLTPENYHDLGQGILDCIYDIYEELINAGLTVKYCPKNE